MMDFEDDLLTLHEDVMEEDDDGVDEILRDYKGDEKSKLRYVWNVWNVWNAW